MNGRMFSKAVRRQRTASTASSQATETASQAASSEERRKDSTDCSPAAPERPMFARSADVDVDAVAPLPGPAHVWWSTSYRAWDQAIPPHTKMSVNSDRVCCAHHLSDADASRGCQKRCRLLCPNHRCLALTLVGLRSKRNNKESGNRAHARAHTKKQ